MTALLLSGCASMDGDYGSTSSGSGASAEQVAQWKEATRKAQSQQDSAQCVDFGYKPGTTEYAKCRENLFNQRQAAQTAAAANQAAITSAVIARGPPQPYPVQVPQQTVPQPYIVPSPITTQCRTDYNGVVTCKTR